MSIKEVPDSNKLFSDVVFQRENAHIASEWQRITEVYPAGLNQPLLPEVFSREQFGQGNHYECFMISALATLVRFPDVIRNCFVTQKVRQDGRYTFQFFRGREWVRVEIDDTIPMEDGEVLYLRSPTEHWWPLLLEKAYAKFYTAYDHLEGCTLQETFHDLTGNPVLNIPMDAKLAKAAGAEVTEGFYWLDLAQRIHSGQFVASVLTKDIELETMGLQREQQYGILEIFSLTGTSSINDIVIRLHNPFEDEEYLYKGPLNSKDTTWDAKQRAKHDVDDERSIFLPLNTFLKIMNSVQLCYITTVASDATYFEDEWKGESAGGNPTSVSWRKNPLYFVCNSGSTALEVVVIIKQEDQRRFMSLTEMTKYLQCGMVLIHYSYANPIPTFWVTGNNHKPIHKSLFLNSREVANTMTIPPNSLCYLVPSCMHKGVDGPFSLALYRMKDVDYSDLTITKLAIPSMNWSSPATKNVELCQKEKDRVDFYVDEATDVHILLHQTKPYVSKSGGDAMTEDYMGMYLYDDTDRKVAGVHAATNFREISAIHRLPRSGRYAISITCPRAKSDVPAYITIIGSHASNVRIVDPPEDATMFDDEDIIDEGEDAALEHNPVDYTPVVFDAARHGEQVESDSPFEDKRFYMDNRGATSDPWVHIGDLYPEGKTVPLLPNELRRDQFGQGDHYDCSTLTAFAALLERHPDVIRNCFVSKNPRKDGRYTFQFHRYGQWVKVEIDDRIPMVKDDTVFCRSPTHHWWPLLLEKAYAKFYTLYENLAGCSLAEVFHDFSGRPVINTPLDLPTTMPAELDITSPMYWLRLRDELRTTAVGAQTGDATENLGLAPHQFYGVLDILVTSASPPRSLSEVVVQLHNPYAAYTYTGPMSDPADPRWASRGMHHISTMQNTICVPADIFLHTFFIMSQVHLLGLIEPCWNFHSEWGDGTNGGNPSLLTWRENPLYTVVNTSNEAVEIMAMIRQPDKRRQLHLLPELSYVRCDLLLAQSMENDSIPTYLVTHNNHQVVQKGIFLNYREVASKIRVPPQSQCYLVPTAMYHEKSIFLLSYWYRRPADERAVSISRLRLNVARDLPAVKHVTMVPEGKDRVDFLVDVPTVAHILLSQWNRDARSSSDVRTDNYVGMYLYDDAKQQVARVSAASNLKEIGLVAYLPAQGRYVLSITCPAARDVEVKCRVEIVCVEAARVRITDAYESAQCCEDLKGQPLVELVDSDTLVDGDRHTTEPVEVAVEKRQAVSAAQLQEKTSRASPADAEAKERALSSSFMRPQYLGIPTGDLPLMENPAFAKMAQEREQLRRHLLQNAARVNTLENTMDNMAARMADDMHKRERAFLGSQAEGIPLELLPLNEDEQFTGLEHTLRLAMKDPEKNRDDVAIWQEMLKKRVREVANEKKASERDLFLNPMHLGLPVDDLPLDIDPEFHLLEVARLRERQQEPCDEAKIRKLNDALNERAERLAVAELAADRQHMKPEHLHVAIDELPLSENRNFVLKEALRREKMKSSCEGATAVAALEDELNDMAKDMAAELLAKQRPSYLAPEHNGRRIADLPLNTSNDFLAKERRRRDLLKQPNPDMNKVIEIEEELGHMASSMAIAMNAAERPQYMKDSYHTKNLGELPLNADTTITTLEAQRARLKYDPLRNAAAIRATEELINSRAAALAKSMMHEERVRLYGKPNGVPVNLLDLHEDSLIRHLEEERMNLLSNPATNPHVINTIEEKLKARAAEIADNFRANMRAEITGEQCRSPSLMSVGSDAPCQDMEEKLYTLLSEDPISNEEQIMDLKEAIRKRHGELKRQAVHALRSFLEEAPFGILLAEVGLDEDPEYMEKEADLQKSLANNSSATQIKAIRDSMQQRVYELAAEKLVRRYPFLSKRPAGIPLAELPILSRDQPFLQAITDLEKTEADEQKTEAQLRAQQEALNQRLHAVAEEQKWKEREMFLVATTAAVPLRLIPLDNDTDFVHLEQKRRSSLRSGNALDIRTIENTLNERAHVLASEKKWADRGKVLDPKPEGVPLSHVPLDEDAEFVALEDEWRGLAQDPRRNERALADLEKAMNDRAHVLASETKWADRGKVLDPKPEGVPLSHVPLDEDAEFVALEDEWRGLAQDPRRNAKEMAAIEEEMMIRVYFLARGLAYCQDCLEKKDECSCGSGGMGIRKDVGSCEEVDGVGALNVMMGRRTTERGFDGLLGSVVDGVPTVLLKLSDDDVFCKQNDEYLDVLKADSELKRIRQLEGEMLDRAHVLARRFKDKIRSAVVGEKMALLAEGGAELDRDETFVALERELFNLEASDDRGGGCRRAALVDSLRQRASELAEIPLHGVCRGISAETVSEVSQKELFDNQPGGRRQNTTPKKNGRYVSTVMGRSTWNVADEIEAGESYLFLGKEVYGIPLDKIPYRDDEVFRGLSEERRRVMNHPEDYSAGYQEEVEDALRRRVEELADEYKRDHIKHTTASDGQPKKPRKPNGAPGESCSPPRRPQGKKKLREVEERTEEHRRETVELASAFTDPPFHDANSQAEDAWPRIADVYPEGLMQPLLPNYPKTSDMASPAGDLTYLAPFLAALSRQPPLLHRLFQVKAHPVRAPYTFVFFDPNGTPVTVGIDDRIPCDANGVPRFTVSPNGAWWPLLVEKAYAKYVGGYDRFDECTSHETLRDLTGRPVTHLPLDAKLSAEVSGCNYRDVTFWRRIHEQLERGDVFMAVSSDMTPDGIHRHCHYAVFDVIETVPGSNDPSDVVVKIHNCYRDAPEYHGPLAKGDSDWTPKLRSVCKADPESEPEFLYVPQPVFLRNFSSMQRCHVNCGDRLTVSGEWTGACSGGNPTYTTFRRNPMYLVQNNSNRNVTVLAELRHSAPVYYDAHNLGVYHLTALALLRPDSNAQLVAPLLAYNTHKFLQKGLLTDAREVCVEMELPANSTCYLIPYTKKKACFGKYQLSVYPQDNPVNLTTLRPIDETHSCLTKDVLVQPGTGTSVRVDLMVSSPCDVHALLHQNKVTDPKSIKRGDHLAEDEIFMAVYENNTALVCSTGDASNAREHAIAFQATKPGRYTFLVGCPSRPVSGDAPCTLIIYTPTYAQARFASLNEPIRPNVPPRVQSSKATTSSASARLGAWQPQVPQRSASTSSIAAQTPRGNPRNRRYL